MHGSKNVKFGRTTSYGLKGLGFETRWVLDFPDPSRPALRPTQHAVQRMPEVKRPRLGVYIQPLLAPGLRTDIAIAPAAIMCLPGRLRDMKQMYQSHGVTSPKT